jgi:hypothetical protein
MPYQLPVFCMLAHGSRGAGRTAFGAGPIVAGRVRRRTQVRFQPHSLVPMPYQLPVFCMLAHGSRGGWASPF